MMKCRESIFGYQNLNVTVGLKCFLNATVLTDTVTLQLYYTPDHLDLCVDCCYDDAVSMETHGVKPDNIYSMLDKWLPKGQSYSY